MGDGCRQAQLLRYFNSQPSFGHSCDNCDVCIGAPEFTGTTKSDRVAIQDDPTTLVRKMLSGVARSRGRAKLDLVGAMLRGSTAQRVHNHGYDRLSTYGLLDYLKPAPLMGFLDLCERHRLVVSDARGFVTLTDEGISVMRGDQPLPSSLEDRLARRVCVTTPEN
jgi:ATP-dependent DNA helicase RecQ